jgi:hypothetical protein
MSEQAAEFNVWARPREGSLAPAVQWTREKWKLPLADAMHQVRLCMETGWVLIHRRCGWLDVPGLVTSLPDFVVPGSAAVTLFEDSVTPSRCDRYCALHALHYVAGIRPPEQTCPVCAGRYIDSVRDGMALRLVRREGEDGDA